MKSIFKIIEISHYSKNNELLWTQHNISNILHNSGKEFILKTLEECKLTIDKTILIGFSAGAVVSLQLAIKFQDPYKLIICHSGAILNPECVSKSQIDTSFVLIHHQDDFCFSWDERYIPMRKSLRDNDYKVMTIESVSGNHTIYNNELKNIKNLISEIVS